MYNYHCTIRVKSRNPGSYCKAVEVNNCWPCTCLFRSLTSKRLVRRGDGVNVLSCFRHISCGTDDPRLESGQGKIFLLSKKSIPTLGPTLPPIQWIPGSSLGVKRPGREVDHSRPCSTDNKNEWICTSAPSPYALVTSGTTLPPYIQ